MNFLHLSHSSNLRRCHRHHFLQLRTLYDAVASLKWPRDRGLDHAVERDKLLKPLLNLKNLIISEPSKSIPLALITDSKDKLGIPFRPIEFIRKYPSIFQEFQPGSLNIQPHIKLTPEIISLTSEENLLYQSVDYKQDLAGRLLKLLMISRVNKIPIVVLERLKWELGLPQDYEKALIPEFPDYFRVIGGEDFGGNEKELELVCWGDEFAVSELEKKGAKKGVFAFSLQFSNDFEMDKKYKKWLDEWQKLPYVSPYKNAMHLEAKADESDKWVVAVLHELLNLFVGKKAERENLLYLGEYLGLRPSFKRAFLQHPGIFYVSSKIGTHTVVLREAYKRGMLNERHTLIDMRSKYIKLMNLNVVKDAENPKTTQKKKKKSTTDVKKSEGDEVKDVEGVDEDSDSDEMYDSSDDDDDESDDYEEAVSDDDESDEYGEAVEVENVTKRGRHEMKGRDFERRNARSEGRMTKGRVAEENVSKSPARSHEMKGRDFERRNTTSVGRRSNGRGNEENLPNSSTRSHEMKGGDFERRSTRKAGWRTNERGTEENVSRSSTRGHRMEDRDFGRMNTRSMGRRMNGRGNEENVSNSSTRSHDMKARDFDRRSTRSGGWRANERGTEENVSRSSTRSNGMQDRDSGRRTNGRGTEENVSRSSTRSHGMQDRDFGRRNTSSVGRRTNGRGTEENVSRRSTRSHGMQDRDFGRRDTSSVGRRTNGRGTEENVSYNSARSSRRPNARGDDSNTPRRFTKKSDFSGRRA